MHDYGVCTFLNLIILLCDVEKLDERLREHILRLILLIILFFFSPKSMYFRGIVFLMEKTTTLRRDQKLIHSTPGKCTFGVNVYCLALQSSNKIVKQLLELSPIPRITYCNDEGHRTADFHGKVGL